MFRCCSAGIEERPTQQRAAAGVWSGLSFLGSGRNVERSSKKEPAQASIRRGTKKTRNHTTPFLDGALFRHSIQISDACINPLATRQHIFCFNPTEWSLISPSSDNVRLICCSGTQLKCQLFFFLKENNLGWEHCAGPCDSWLDELTVQPQ